MVKITKIYCNFVDAFCAIKGAIQMNTSVYERVTVFGLRGHAS